MKSVIKKYFSLLLYVRRCSLPSHKNEAPMAGDSSELGSETDEEEEVSWSSVCLPGMVRAVLGASAGEME